VLVKHFSNCEMRSVVVSLEGGGVPPDHMHFPGGTAAAKAPGADSKPAAQ
jgi:hypothetical protein